jgi:hypothetical protein
MRLLLTRLYDAERQRLHDERAAERKSKVGSGDRNERIRPYNFPQNRVTDHRVNENYSLAHGEAARPGCSTRSRRSSARSGSRACDTARKSMAHGRRDGPHGARFLERKKGAWRRGSRRAARRTRSG